MSEVERTPITIVQHLALELRRASGSTAVERAAREAGLEDPLLMPPDARISVLDEARFAEASTIQSGDIDFCIRSGLNYQGISTIAQYVARHSPNLRTALMDVRAFTTLGRPGLRPDLVESSNAARITIDFDDVELSRSPRYHELVVCGMVALIRRFTQRIFTPYEIIFQHPRVAPARDVEIALRCPIVFGAENIEVLFPTSALDWDIPTWDENLRKLLIAQGDQMLAELAQQEPDIVGISESAIARSFPQTVPSVATIANELGMSERSLSRKLQDNGTSFREILHDVMLRLACQYLRDTKLPIGEVAYLLGYSNQSSFSSAFRRETGKTPRDFRQYGSQGPI